MRAVEKIAKALGLTLEQLINISPQTLINLTQNPGSGLNHGTRNNADTALVEELRQQLKAKEDYIKFLQTQFPPK